MIDALVEMCQAGQGHIGAQKAQSGVWNPNAVDGGLPGDNVLPPEVLAASRELMATEQKRNELLAGLSEEQRETLAGMLAQEVVTGVFETLKLLEEQHVAPFESGYEGSAYNDFIGRLGDWDWPES